MKERIIDDDFICRLETMALYLQNPMRGFFGGNHRTDSYGQTVEFADFREYVLGDDIRYVDWNLYGRFEKHFVRLFADERQMHMRIFLDCSASMEKADREKARFALRATAALGFLSAQNMDKTSFLFMKGGFADNPCGLMTGKNSFYLNLARLEELEFKGETDIEKAVTNYSDDGTNDGLTVIISDFLTESDWKKAVDYLIFRKRQVMLIQVLSPEELNPFNNNGRMFLRDAEAGDITDERHMKMKITKAHIEAYRDALRDFKAGIKAFCASRGVTFLSADCGEPVDRFLFRELLTAGTVR
ncbi:MAG: DUF58 domain-containing protein [Clostridiales bacterium]|jgi:uncharacterized protein (DUF58 family)|nr:DUF58 domain-containing protein [Clostridiales bacterium]